MLNLTPYILLAPLLGFLALGLFGRFLPRAIISIIGCGVILVALVLAAADFFAVMRAAHKVSDVHLFTWLTSGSLTVSFGLLSDPLSAVMLLIVTGVGFLIHVYSIGYMEDDPGYWRFFAFLNFFVFAMALLVAADDFLLLLVGWAGVGLASFLLIGFWYTRPSAVAAARKAFVVNVIGDFGLMIALFLLFGAYNSFAYSVIFGARPLDSGTLTAITLTLFVAAAAKSAQLPLHVWLPDAMEGPTPVSALIHAATMVTAGVYLVARAAPLFSAAPTTLGVIGGIGGASALFAATIACVQTDIKRVLAYSTMSQLGYMFMAEAAGGFSAGIYHLMTHAFFKALLFMCAGAVIHALGGEQDIRKMGGLRRKLSATYQTFVVGGLALAAIFPFAGFWSKDAILGALLERATTGGGTAWYVLYAIGLLTAMLTGFYIFRLIFLVFHGTYRGAPVVAHGANAHGATAADPLANVHEPGGVMLSPMYALAALSLIGGGFGAQALFNIADFSAFLAPAHVPSATELPTGLFWLSLGLSLALAISGAVFAYIRYGSGQTYFVAEGSENALVKLLQRRYYVDDIYDAVLVRPIVGMGRWLRGAVEDEALDAGSRDLGGAIGSLGDSLRGFQTGFTRNYAVYVFVGVILFVLFFVSTRP